MRRVDAAARSRRRLRRARLAGAPRRSRRAPRRRLADRRPPRRHRRRLRPAPCACRARDRPWARRRAARGARGHRARRGRGALGRAPRQLQGVRASTTCSPSRGRTSRSSRSACSGWPGCSASRGSRPRSSRIAAIAGYVLAVGWQPSVVRAGVAGGLASLAWLLSRPRDRWHFLALGAAVLLAWTPASLLEPGFQLSFAAVGAIFLLLPRLRRALEGYPLPIGCATRSRSRPRAERRRRRSCGSSSAACRSTRCSRTCSSRSAIGPLLGLALVGSLIEPRAARRRRSRSRC